MSQYIIIATFMCLTLNNRILSNLIIGISEDNYTAAHSRMK